MTIGIIGRKCGMTRVFTEEGDSIPVTVIDASPNRVTQVKNDDNDGYRGQNMLGKLLCELRIEGQNRRAKTTSEEAAGKAARHLGENAAAPGNNAPKPAVCEETATGETHTDEEDVNNNDSIGNHSIDSSVDLSHSRDSVP